MSDPMNIIVVRNYLKAIADQRATIEDCVNRRMWAEAIQTVETLHVFVERLKRELQKGM